MAATKDFISIGSKSWDDAKGPLDSWLSRLNTRLDAQEGRSGTPRFYADLDAGTNKITNGPATLTPAATDFITKGYADSQYGPTVIRDALQVSGSAPLNINDLPGGNFIVGGTTNYLAKFASATSLGTSSIIDDGTSILIGLTAATDATHLRMEIQKNQNNSSGVLIQNTTNGTLARATIVVRAESGTDDLTLLVTSTAYTTASGIPALTAALIAGAGATGGMIIQTAAGSVALQIAGTVSQFIFDSTSALTIGLAGIGTGKVKLVGTTSGTVTQTVAAAAGTWTFTLPTSGGTANFALITNGSGVSSWVTGQTLAGLTTADSPVFNGLTLTNPLAIASGGTGSATGFTCGTWTPSVKFGGGNTGITYAGQFGYYEKITSSAGTWIRVTCYFGLANKGSSTGTATIEGLPVALINDGSYLANAAIYADNLQLIVGQLQAYAAPNTTVLNPYYLGTGTGTALADTNFKNNSVFMISMSYKVA